MEKYSRFRDEATGIAPFQPPRPNSASFTWLETAANFVFSVLSVPLALLGLVNYFVFAKLLLPAVLAQFVLNYTVLLPLRVLYVAFTYDGERRVSVRKRNLRRAAPGDVLVSNFQSPLDALVYESHQKCVFAFPTKDGLFERASALGAALRALSIGVNSPRGVPLSAVCESARRSGAIVVLFAEGTTTSGRGLLTLKHTNFREVAAVEGHVYAAAIRYAPGSTTSPVPSGVVPYVWRIARASWWYMATVKVSGEALAKSTISKDEISKSIAGLGRVRLLGDKLDAGSKQEYCNLKQHRR